MKRAALWKLLLVVWLMAPAAALAWHFGPGESYRLRDDAGDRIRSAKSQQQAESYLNAARDFADAREALPQEDRAAHHRLTLAEAQARLRGGEVFEGIDQLEALVADCESSEQADPKLLEAARHELGMAGYYTGWIMRVEGGDETEWKPEVERARQQFRLLAESAQSQLAAAPVNPGELSQSLEAHQKNLEAAIRLERMDLAELIAKPLPKNCNCNGNGKSLCQQKRKQAQSKKKGKGQQDARSKVKQSTGAGLSKREGSGS